ncbi:MAG TPA: fatty acid desaturase CarF family protein [Pseudobdellovibrionaceae bacterium]|nr:fatty acid desaturase CarF family protein [Pseudobdellovibrionaceae bacterium]
MKSLRIHRLIESGSCALGLLLTAFGFLSLLRWAGSEPHRHLIVLAVVIASAALADLISGLVHGFADHFGDPQTPWLGPAFIAPFREHHDLPMKMTEHDFIETNGNTFILICLALVLAYGLGGSMWMAFLAPLCAWVAATNQIHKWAHDPERAPAVYRWLARHELILSAKRHAFHHRGEHASHFCITFGRLSFIADRIVNWARDRSLRSSQMGRLK